MSVYTKTGDNGKTMLQNGTPIQKHHPIIQAMAALDELNAHLGIIKSHLPSEPTNDIEKIQKTIMAMLALISTAEQSPTANTGFDELFADEVTALETKIDAINSVLPPITSFVTYGTTSKSAAIDLARAVARRAETNLAQIAETSSYAKATLAYINRLSDFLYVKARYEDFKQAVTQAVKESMPPTKHIGEQQRNLESNLDVSRHKTYDITLIQAKTMLERIECIAKERNQSIVAACVNAAASPVAIHVMDGAFLVSYEAALAKAYTAAALKMPTADLSRLVQPGQQFYGLESIGSGKILPIGGGIPLFNSEGHLIGAIGISGGTAEEDHELASLASKHI